MLYIYTLFLVFFGGGLNLGFNLEVLGGGGGWWVVGGDAWQAMCGGGLILGF